MWSNQLSQSLWPVLHPLVVDSLGADDAPRDPRVMMTRRDTARRFLKWLNTYLSIQTIAERIAEGLREIALLWFVFANLDIIVQTSHFSWSWSIKNTVGTAIVWLFAVIFEAVIEKRRE